MRHAQLVISKAVRRRHAVLMYRRHQDKKEKEGYSFAARTVHVGGIGKEWEDEEKIAAWFRRGGPVVSVVLRKRAPEPNIPNNSWALVAFRDGETLTNLFSLAAEQADATVGSEETVLLRADVADKAKDAVIFIVRRIDPTKAMTSVGSFGKTFQRCMQKLEMHEKKLYRAARARQKRLEARQVRWRVLATPFSARAQTKEEMRMAALDAAEMALRNLPRKLDGSDQQRDEAAVVEVAGCMSAQREIVMAEFSDGWIQCCQWPPAGATVHSPSPTLVEMEQQGRPYYFNVRTGESRWLAPPSLSVLSKTKARARPVRTAGAIPRTPRVSGPAAGGIYRQTLRRRKAWHSSDELKSAQQPESARGQQRRSPAAAAPSPPMGCASSSSRQGGRAASKYNSKQRRVVKQCPVPVQSDRPAAFVEDVDPVAYMVQWQHQKYLSGPKARELDCFVPKPAQRVRRI